MAGQEAKVMPHCSSTMEKVLAGMTRQEKSDFQIEGDVVATRPMDMAAVMRPRAKLGWLVGGVRGEGRGVHGVEDDFGGAVDADVLVDDSQCW